MARYNPIDHKHPESVESDEDILGDLLDDLISRVEKLRDNAKDGPTSAFYSNAVNDLVAAGAAITAAEGA